MKEDNGSEDGREKKRLIQVLGFYNECWVRRRMIPSIKGRAVRKEGSIRFIM